MWQNSTNDVDGNQFDFRAKESREALTETQSSSQSLLEIRDQIEKVCEQIDKEYGGKGMPVKGIHTALSTILIQFADRIQQILMKNWSQSAVEGQNQSRLRDQNAYLRGFLDLLTTKNTKSVQRIAYLEARLAKCQLRLSSFSQQQNFKAKGVKLSQKRLSLGPMAVRSLLEPKCTIFSRLPNVREISKRVIEKCESTMDPSKLNLINQFQPLTRLTENAPELESPNQSMILSDILRPADVGVHRYNSKQRELQKQIRALEKECGRLTEANKNANVKLHQKNAQILDLLRIIESQ